jgi:RHS repeat-associated protein
MDRITSMTHSVDGTSTFSYDKESQVTGADHASPISDETFSYDATGNRTMSGYDTDPNNQTVSDGTYDYQYDDEGNRTRKTTISTGYYEEYAWDYRNRLTGVSFYDDSDTLLQSVEYTYDIFNRWLRRTYDADGEGGASATDTFFAYDGQSINPSLQFDGAASSDLTNRYTWGPNVDQILASEDVTSLSSAGNVLWGLADHLGTIRDIADLNEGTGTTTVTNHRFYDSFGVLKSETNSAVDLIFGNQGKPLDEITGLANYVNRWLDSLLGKWANEDQSTFKGGDANLSRGFHNDPIHRVDPEGLQDGFSDLFGPTPPSEVLKSAYAYEFTNPPPPPVVDLGKGSIDHTKMMALLAQSAYERQDLYPVKQQGWQILQIYSDKDTGFHAIAFINKEGNVVLAYAGTDDGMDWVSNIGQSVGLPTPQYEKALDLAQKYKEWYGSELQFTGHSLGGGLATASALATDSPASTFNPAGVFGLDVRERERAAQFIEVHRVRSEPLTSLQDSQVLGLLGFLMPNTVGNIKTVAPTSSDPVGKHGMGDVLLGMENRDQKVTPERPPAAEHPPARPRAVPGWR